ncbi:DNA-invertase hin [Rhodococcus sp. 66b]|nr:DNA-invertase hin [Rhodococcus sp. 66b]
MIRQSDQPGECCKNPSHCICPETSPVGEFCNNCALVSDFLGYARVSTTDQNPELQQDALNAAGCFRIWTDKASGAKTDRPELAAVMDALRPGDTLVVWRLDRLGRSLPHLIETVTQLEARGVAFKSLTEEINTTTPGGKLIFHIFGALAEFERNLIRERTMAGLSAARDRGRVGGLAILADRSEETTGEQNAWGRRIHDRNCGSVERRPQHPVPELAVRKQL